MSDQLVIQSHRGPYTVFFDSAVLGDARPLLEGEPHFLLDANVARLYGRQLAPVIRHPNAIVIEAAEENKSIEATIPVFRQLVSNKIRRDHVLVAIGGGVVQDVTCFIASVLLRGVQWRFVPTTLLAQADSCIGSKSSINLGDTKNILGTFNPPSRVFIDTNFLATLSSDDLCSGIGEIVKIHAVEGVAAFDRLASDYDRLFSDRALLLSYVRASLLIKRRFIEADEFDREIRNVLNYGHSFGHAIESATRYAIPHGIAVAMGADMANFIAARRGLLPEAHYHRMHPIIRKTYASHERTPIPPEALVSALMKDKKNTSNALRLIFPVGERAEVTRMSVLPDETFRAQCLDYLAQLGR